MKRLILLLLVLPMLASAADRSYLVSVSQWTNMPALILVFHGHTETASGVIGLLGQPENTVIVAPQGIGNSWDACHCCGEAYDRQVDDIAFIDTLIDQMIIKYGADPDRVFLVGRSNGGMLCHRFAGAFPGKIAAFADVSGCIGGQATPYSQVAIPEDPSRAVSVFMVHGQVDTVVQIAQDWDDPGPGRRDVSFEDGVKFWRERCGYDRWSEQEITPEYELNSYVSSTPNPRRPRGLVSMVLKNVGHEIYKWDFVRDKILDFFEKHPRRVARQDVDRERDF